jgi:hypothetical protein
LSIGLSDVPGQVRDRRNGLRGGARAPRFLAIGGHYRTSARPALVPDMAATLTLERLFKARGPFLRADRDDTERRHVAALLVADMETANG